MSRYNELTVDTLLVDSSIKTNVANGIIPIIFAVAADTVTDTAAVSVANYQSNLVTTAASVPTLANGSVIGQMKKIRHTVHAVGSAVLTPVSLNGGTTIAFSVVGDTAELIWDGSGWTALALYNDAAGTAATPVLA